jgi:hypothetical protein
MNRHHPAGMMLAEMLAVLVLTAACVMLASRIAAESYRQGHDLPAAERKMVRLDGVLTQLRRDMWGATSAQTDRGGVRIHHGERHVDWVVDDAGTLRRWQDGQQQAWPELAPGLTWESRPAVLIARWPDGTEIRCVSQLQLAGGGR